MSVADAAPSIVTIADRPDLAPPVAAWLWQAFWREEGASLIHVETLVAAATARSGVPQCFVLHVGGVPAGTASLVAHDLDSRPELTPWLAAVFVAPEWRGRGLVRSLVKQVETVAREALVPTLWLYTNTAERIYAHAGWQTVDRFDHKGKNTALMCRDLSVPAVPAA